MTRTTIVRRRLGTGIALLALFLAGCGGGSSNDGAPPAAQSAEAQANVSVAALLDYTRRQIHGGTSESSEPRNVDALRPPVSDADEPSTL
jgi:hypothetical protein